MRRGSDDINLHAPLDGIHASGWSLTYDDTPNDFLSALEKVNSIHDLSLSLGTWTQPDGTVVDVVAGSPAFTAGLAPAMRLIAIDGREWTVAAARDAITRAEKHARALELVVSAGDLVRTLRVDYHGGLRYPHLTRNGSRRDTLSEILAPRLASDR